MEEIGRSQNCSFFVDVINAAQKMKFFIKDFFIKCDQMRSFLWLHLLKKSLKENLIFCAVKGMAPTPETRLLFHGLMCAWSHQFLRHTV